MYGNTITIVGNLARDFELRFVGSNGTALASSSVAVYAGKDQSGTEKPAHFVDITVWGDEAQNASESFKKGDRVIVLGSVQQERWETDGQKRSKVTVRVEEIGGSARWATVSIARKSKDFNGVTVGASSSKANNMESPF